MKIGILLCCYNRPEYLKQCLWSLERVELPEDHTILLIDDASTDSKTKELMNQSLYYIIHNPINVGIKESLLKGYKILFDLNCDLVINFDSDAIIRSDAVTKLIENYIPNTILTGFHSITKNSNGTDRHKIISETDKLYFKQSVGGINFCIDKQAYESFVKPALLHSGNWDHNSCINAGCAYCLKESVVQHIGYDSSLNHTEQPDVSDDFYYWDLPQVTLLCVDNQHERIKPALKKCTEFIRFGDIQLLHPDIRSKEAYSQFIVKEAHKYVKTSHCLIFQHDGFVNNWQAWDDSWLEYDYIGAPWHYNDGMAVGNGGFSLRSQRFMELCSRIVGFCHPEDHHICRTYRKTLEAHGMKFAPVEVAEKFSFEGYLQPDKFLKDQFGRHGSQPRTQQQIFPKKDRLVFNQFLSLGDILFLVPMARALMQEGNDVLWPIDEKYLSIRKHFPDINFVPKHSLPLNYDYQGVLPTPYGKLLPYRFASELRGKTLHECMQSKYALFGHDWHMWRLLYWTRDFESEKRLIKYLNLPNKFNLVNRYYGHQSEMKIDPIINNKLPVIEMRNLDGFTLIDWLGIVELATEIHASNSSLNYLIELMDIKVLVYLYKRRHWGEQTFEYTRDLWSNKAFIFVE